MMSVWTRTYVLFVTALFISVPVCFIDGRLEGILSRNDPLIERNDINDITNAGTNTNTNETIQCNKVICSVGEYCCNESCSTCVKEGDSCLQDICPVEVTCNQTICNEGEYCCNESCSLCVPNGDFCTTHICEDNQKFFFSGRMIRRFMDFFRSILFDRRDDSSNGDSGDSEGDDEDNEDEDKDSDGGIAKPTNQCKDVVCSEGEFCCNESCSICAPLGGTCKDEICNGDNDTPTVTQCEIDSDCPSINCITVPCPQPVCVKNTCLIIPEIVPVGTVCGPSICTGDDICCNELCGICQPNNSTCDTLPDWCRTITPCGSSYCKGEYVCCNEKCGLCSLPGEACPGDDSSCEQQIPCGNNNFCSGGEFCCNERCGICAPTGASCASPSSSCIDIGVLCGSSVCVTDKERCCTDPCGTSTCVPLEDDCPTTTTTTTTSRTDSCTPCGATFCKAGLECCNPSCGICAPPDTPCSSLTCEVPNVIPCGTNNCPDGSKCCSESCGICVPQVDVCPVVPPCNNVDTVQCGDVFCSATEQCCQLESCGLCIPTGKVCPIVGCVDSP